MLWLQGIIVTNWQEYFKPRGNNFFSNKFVGCYCASLCEYPLLCFIHLENAFGSIRNVWLGKHIDNQNDFYHFLIKTFCTLRNQFLILTKWKMSSSFTLCLISLHIIFWLKKFTSFLHLINKPINTESDLSTF